MNVAEPPTRESTLLALWESALDGDRWQREDALLGGAAHAPRLLGERNRALLDLRNRLFARDWPLHSICPECGEASAFEVDGMALADALGRSVAETRNATGGLRPVAIDDLVAAGGEGSAEETARTILARCLGHPPGAEIDAAAMEELGRALELADPAALIRFALACPGCAHQWSSAFDVGAAMWSEVQRAAETLLLEVDALARAYGWSEREVLCLSPARRAAYLQLVEVDA